MNVALIHGHTANILTYTTRDSHVDLVFYFNVIVSFSGLDVW